MHFSDGWGVEVAAVSSKGPLVCAAVSSTENPHLGTFKDTGTSDNYPSPCPNRPPSCGLHWGPPQGAFLHGMGSCVRKEAGRRGRGAMWWVVCGRGLLMWGVTMSEIDARWAVGTVGIGQSERACATSDECIVLLKCIAECIEPPAWLDQPSTCVHMQGYGGPHISRMHQRKSHQRMVLSSRNSACRGI